MGFQGEGDLIYLMGKLSGKVGGSEYLKALYDGGELERTDLELERRLARAMLALVERRLLRSAHDIAEGGLLVALAEKSFARGLGARLALEDLSEETLFGEWPSRLVVTVSPQHEDALSKLLESAKVPYQRVGTVTGDALELGGERVSVTELRRAYETAIEL